MNEPPNPEVAVFAAALELPADQRGAYLDQACAGDAALRGQVEALLRVHEEAGNFFDKLATVARPASTRELMAGLSDKVQIPGILSEKAGDRIGRFKLLQQIGEGGCGVVYMAEQEEPVRRRVALKVIKLGMDTKSVIARFEAERQALALMDHPNVAKVLEAGATDTGRPYFVMELVRGVKITDYCDENNLSTVTRLELFIQVCQAIQHAHQKGIIHRDIKPSNILVADHDGRAVPKIIDFGIAKATTDQRLTDKTLFTAFEQFIGTPAYMSPEQARLSGLDIDTRSDIYSLGVLLYELLTARTPFETKRLHEIGLDEIRRIIREEEPVRPSTKLATLDAAEKITVAKHRQSDPPKLAHLIRGDLDWIVMKALEKDRTRRYETANGLASDVRRYLNCEAIVARPPSRWYEFQKTVRRNRFGFGAAAAVFVVLTAGVAVSTSEAVRARRAEQEQSRLRETAQKETEFIKGMLKTTLPQAGSGTNVPINLAILDQLPNAPETEAELRKAVADAYMDLGRYDEASVMRDRVSILQGMLGGGNPPVSSQNGVTPIVDGAAALLSVALAALAVLALKRRLRLLTYVFIPLSLWVVAMVLGLAETGSAVRFAVWSLTGVVIGVFGMILRLRRIRRLPAGAASVEAKTNGYPVKPWVDAVAGLGVFVVLVMAIYGFEDWRGKRAWENCKREYAAKGYALDWDQLIPPPVPDDQNFFKAPKMAEWFGHRATPPVQGAVSNGVHSTGASEPARVDTNKATDLIAAKLAGRLTTAPAPSLEINRDHETETVKIADIIFLTAENAETNSDAADIVLNSLSTNAISPEELSRLKKLLRDEIGISVPSALEYPLLKKPLSEIRPMRVALHSRTLPEDAEIIGLIEQCHPNDQKASNDYLPGLRIEHRGTNAAQVMLRGNSAAGYLEWSDQCAPAFQLMREAVKRPYARIQGDYDDPFGDNLTPNFVAMRTVSQMLATRSACHLLMDQPDKALADLTLARDLVRHVLEFPPSGKPMPLVCAMINAAISEVWTREVALGINLRVWQGPQLVRLQEELQQIHLPSLVNASMQWEAAGSSRLLELSSRNPLMMLGHKTWTWEDLKSPLFWLLQVAPRGWVYQNMVENSELELEMLHNDFNPTNDLVSPHEIGNHSLAFDRFNTNASRSLFKVLARIAIPNFTRAWQITAHHQTMINEAQIACALERYRRGHAEYPERLDALVPQFMDKIPPGLIDGLPPRYRRTDDGTFLLYSIGWTETDHGGQSGSKAEEGDWVWMDDGASNPPAGLNRAKLTLMTAAPLFPPAVNTNLTAGNEIMEAVQFDQIPLSNAVAELAKQTQVKIQFDPVIVNQKAADGTPILSSYIKEKWKKVTAWQTLQALLDNYGWQMKVTPGPAILVTAKETNSNGPLETPVNLEVRATTGATGAGAETADLTFDGVLLGEVVRQLAVLSEVNVLFDPRLAKQQDLMLKMNWKKVTARQALQGLLDNQGWQIVQIPGNPIFRIIPKNP